jgi:hypothetical protein
MSTDGAPRLYWYRHERGYWLTSFDGVNTGDAHTYFRAGCTELFLTYPTWFNSTEEAIQAAAAVGFTVEKGTADYHG